MEERSLEMTEVCVTARRKKVIETRIRFANVFKNTP